MGDKIRTTLIVCKKLWQKFKRITTHEKNLSSAVEALIEKEVNNHELFKNENTK